ncbi:MAG: Uncharacterised protein [Flavobacteriales bacterium UBA4585]|nr:MAG: Uncharacterised protein [Flavobacteriales bacterium UBA4585]
MLKVSGNNIWINTYDPIPVRMIDTQLPMFNARCTSGSLALLSLMRMKNVPMIENIIPTPAIIIGSMIGPWLSRKLPVLIKLSLIT